MGKDLFDNFPAAKQVFEEADEALGFSLSEMCFSGDEADLQLTANTQPAILTVSVAAFRAMESEGFQMPDFVAGHSLGEYSALVAAEAMSFSDAVKTVRKRGTYMQEAVPVGVGAMAAILGLPILKRSKLFAKKRRKIKFAVRQILIRRRKSLLPEILTRLTEQLKSKGKGRETGDKIKCFRAVSLRFDETRTGKIGGRFGKN